MASAVELLPRPSRILSVICCGVSPALSSCVIVPMPIRFCSSWSKVSSEQNGSICAAGMRGQARRREDVGVRMEQGAEACGWVTERHPLCPAQQCPHDPPLATTPQSTHPITYPTCLSELLPEPLLTCTRYPPADLTCSCLSMHTPSASALLVCSLSAWRNRYSHMQQAQTTAHRRKVRVLQNTCCQPYHNVPALRKQ